VNQLVQWGWYRLGELAINKWEFLIFRESGFYLRNIGIEQYLDDALVFIASAEEKCSDLDFEGYLISTFEPAWDDDSN
jgi:hypothetical protein